VNSIQYSVKEKMSMSDLPYVKSFRDLIVYQKARQLSREIFAISQSFPREEMFALTDQKRPSSRSIGAQIAEAWAKGGYERHFVSKLTDADGEQQETQHWLETAVDCDYLPDKQSRELLSKCTEIGRLIGGMIARSNMFCTPHSKTLRESTAEYFITDTDY
jgi:four helix bundle protein